MGKELPVGSKLGPYTIERVLSRIGLCEVYAARAEAPKGADSAEAAAGEPRPCRVTVFHIDPTGEPWRRFERECQALKALSHPCIAEILEVTMTADGTPYVVHGLPAGEDLATRLRRAGALTTREALVLARQVGSALHAAHGIDQLHRDLTPENLFLGPPSTGGEPAFERVQVLGFGVNRLLEGAVEGALLVGRAEYMAPEQITGFSIEVGPSADQYTLALILYQVLTVSQPFRGESVGASLLKVVRSAPEPLRALRPDIPAHIEAAIMRALSKERTVRFPDTATFVQALQGDEPLPEGLSERTDAWLKSGASTEGAAPSLQAVTAGLQALEPVPVVVEDQATVPNNMEDVMRLAVPPVRLRVVELSPVPDSSRVRAVGSSPGSGPRDPREKSGRTEKGLSEPEILSPSNPGSPSSPSTGPKSSPSRPGLSPLSASGKRKVQHSGISEEDTSPDQVRGPELKAAIAKVSAPAPTPTGPAALAVPQPAAPVAPPASGAMQRVLLVVIGLVLGFLLGWALRA